MVNLITEDVSESHDMSLSSDLGDEAEIPAHSKKPFMHKYKSLSKVETQDDSDECCDVEVNQELVKGVFVYESCRYKSGIRIE